MFPVFQVTTMALCKLFEYGVATQDNRLTTITFRELVDDVSDTRRRTRSVAASTQKWVTIPALVKIFKVLISEYQHFQEGKLDEPLTDSEEDEDDDGPGNAAKPRYVSDLCFEGEDDSAEDELLLQELLKETNYQGDIADNLQKFLTTFTQNEHFPTFFEHLTEAERLILLTKVQQK